MDRLLKGIKYESLAALEFNPNLIIQILKKMTPKELFVFMEDAKKDGLGLKARSEVENLSNKNENGILGILSDGKIWSSFLEDSGGHGYDDNDDDDDGFVLTRPISMEEYFVRRAEELVNEGRIRKIFSKLGRSLFNDHRLLCVLGERKRIPCLKRMISCGILYEGTAMRLKTHSRAADENGDNEDVEEEEIGTVTRHDIQNTCFLLEYVVEAKGKRDKIWALSNECKSLHFFSESGNYIVENVDKGLTSQGAFFVSLFVFSVIEYCTFRCSISKDLVVFEVLEERRLNETNETTENAEKTLYFYDIRNNLFFDDLGTFFKYNVYDYQNEPLPSSNEEGLSTPIEVLFSETPRDIVNCAIKKGFSLIGTDVLSSYLSERLFYRDEETDENNERESMKIKVQKHLFEKPFAKILNSVAVAKITTTTTRKEAKATEKTKTKTTAKKRKRRSTGPDEIRKLQDLPSVVKGDDDILKCDERRLKKFKALFRAKRYSESLAIMVNHFFGRESGLIYPRRDEFLPPPHCFTLTELCFEILKRCGEDFKDADEIVVEELKNALRSSGVTRPEDGDEDDPFFSKHADVEFDYDADYECTNTTKGCAGDLVILDEAAYASPDLVFETIFPLLEVHSTAMIAISTVLDEFNFFSKLLLLKDEDGDDFFCVIMIDLLCSACRRLPKEMHKNCTHLDDTILPPWKSKEKNKRAKIIQTVDPNVGRNARESMGIITGDYNQALNDALVKRTMDAATRKYHTVKHSPDRIFVTIDPDGGGRSRLSVMSGFICSGEKTREELPGTLVIIGIDYKQCSSDLEQDAVVEAHIKRIRGFAMFERVPIILVPENQSGFFHNRIERNFTNVPNCRTLHEYNQEKPGVRKDANKTKEYVIRVNDMLKGGLIKFSKDWFTNTKKEYAVGQEFVILELRDEMIRYCYDEHGKLTGKINGSNDDLYIAFAMLCYFGTVVTVSPVYKEYWACAA